ncbi:nuclear transport factor 2 family protein [Mycobacterium colombiense]|nr:nuclear transport factor 2 family protein [Mycobacterium colombiense]
MTEAADELEAIRQLKARYCRFLDTKDVGAWRDVFAPGGYTGFKLA